MEGSNYNALSRFLHKISLGSKAVSEISFDIEKSIYHKSDVSHITDGKHLFVSGLARSGTTALMRSFYETKEFASLTYAEMPFILAPNFGNKLVPTQKNTNLKERAHKDGIFINNESPEALDEVFLKVFLNDKYIQSDRLTINTISTEVLDLYATYIDLILLKNYKGTKLRYLSKNNNNILRFSSLIQKFPNSTIIITFRDPLQHALSLLHQHQHFCKIQKEDTFVLNYMNWLGHHEFGLNQKPFFLGNEELFAQLLKHDKEDINYWLLSWLNYYSYVLANFSKTCILFSYEQFCNEPTAVMNKLVERIGLQKGKIEQAQFDSTSRTSNNTDTQLLSSCMEVYTKLCELI